VAKGAKPREEVHHVRMWTLAPAQAAPFLGWSFFYLISAIHTCKIQLKTPLIAGYLFFHFKISH
jgi:hypothetical protein